VHRRGEVAREPLHRGNSTFAQRVQQRAADHDAVRRPRGGRRLRRRSDAKAHRHRQGCPRRRGRADPLHLGVEIGRNIGARSGDAEA